VDTETDLFFANGLAIIVPSSELVPWWARLERLIA
jgi:hypothetical protein